jgi:hypothetical protein
MIMTASQNVTDSEQNWLTKQGFDPNTARWKFWVKNFIARREGDVELPPGVTEERRKVDLLRMAEQVDRIDKYTKQSGGILKAWANSVKQFTKDLRD